MAVRLPPKLKDGVELSLAIVLFLDMSMMNPGYAGSSTSQTGQHWGASCTSRKRMHVCAGHSLLGVFYELLLRERPAPAYADYMRRTSSIGLAAATLYQAWRLGLEVFKYNLLKRATFILMCVLWALGEQVQAAAREFTAIDLWCAFADSAILNTQTCWSE